MQILGGKGGAGHTSWLGMGGGAIAMQASVAVGALAIAPSYCVTEQCVAGKTQLLKGDPAQIFAICGCCCCLLSHGSGLPLGFNW